MISVITTITNRKNLKTLQENLVALEADWHLGVDLLCLVGNENLYLEVRDYVASAVDKGEPLVVYDDKGLKAGQEYLGSRNEYVFLLGENIRIPTGCLTKLMKDFDNKKSAGFIGGVRKELPSVYWVDDIYGSPHYVYSNEKKDLEGLIEVDVSPVYGLLTKTQLYKELFCLSDLDGYGSLSYGIRLRRQGYKNYLSMEVGLRDGGEK